MSAVHGLNTYVKWGTNDISAYVSSLNAPRDKDEVDVTTFTATAKSSVVGLQNNILELSGPFDSTLDGYFGPDYEAGTSRAVEWATNGGTASATNPVYSVTGGYLLSYNVTTSTTDAAKFTARIRLNGTVTRTVA